MHPGYAGTTHPRQSGWILCEHKATPCAAYGHEDTDPGEQAAF